MFGVEELHAYYCLLGLHNDLLILLYKLFLCGDVMSSTVGQYHSCELSSGSAQEYCKKCLDSAVSEVVTRGAFAIILRSSAGVHIGISM